jgi:hypothetical protein
VAGGSLVAAGREFNAAPAGVPHPPRVPAADTCADLLAAGVVALVLGVVLQRAGRVAAPRAILSA